MRLTTSLSVALALSAFVPGAQAQVTDLFPAVEIIYGDQTLIVDLRQDGKVTVFDDTFVVGQDGDIIEITGLMDPDPSISYGVTVTDFGAPSAFGFFFFSPIVATGPGVSVAGSLVGGLTDAVGDGVILTALGPTVQVSDLHFPATSMGVPVGLTEAEAGTGIPSSVFPYGPYSSGLIPGPAGGPWTAMSVTTSFVLSGGGDIASLTGSAVVLAAPVPEAGPGLAGTFLVMGGLLLAGRAISRRQSQA